MNSSRSVDNDSGVGHKKRASQCDFIHVYMVWSGEQDCVQLDYPSSVTRTVTELLSTIQRFPHFIGMREFRATSMREFLTSDQSPDLSLLLALRVES